MMWWEWLLLWLPVATAVALTTGKTIRRADIEEEVDDVR